MKISWRSLAGRDPLPLTCENSEGELEVGLWEHLEGRPGLRTLQVSLRTPASLSTSGFSSGPSLCFPVASAVLCLGLK